MIKNLFVLILISPFVSCGKNEKYDNKKALKEAFEKLSPKCILGHSLEPIFIDVLRLDAIIFGTNTFDLKLTKIQIHGLSRFIDRGIKDVKFQRRNNEESYEISLRFPLLTMTSNYHVNGSLAGVFNVWGNGSANFNYIDVDCSLEIILENNPNKLLDFQTQINSLNPQSLQYSNVRISTDNNTMDNLINAKQLDSPLHQLTSVIFWRLTLEAANKMHDHILNSLNLLLRGKSCVDKFKN